jgi:hypothetical protein
MKINLQVTFENGTTKDVTCNAADFVAFEDKYNVSIGVLGAETKLSHLLFLTWHSEFRNKATTESFDKWLDSVVSVGDSGDDPKSKG